MLRPNAKKQHALTMVIKGYAKDPVNMLFNNLTNKPLITITAKG